jgi:Zn-dependent protease with chaperone function
LSELRAEWSAAETRGEAHPAPSNARFSPWKGKWRERAFTDEDARQRILRLPEEQQHQHLHSSSLSQQAAIELLPVSLRPKWLLPWSRKELDTDKLLSSSAAGGGGSEGSEHSSVHVHTRPPRAAKSLLRRWGEIALSLGVIGFSLWFYHSHLELVPIVGREHFVALSPAMEAALGTFLFERVLADKTVLTDARDPRVRLVQEVGARLAQASGRHTDWAWEFAVVDDAAINAQCFPGGKVVVFTGMLDLLFLREQQYRERVQLRGLRPLGSLQQELELAAREQEERRKAQERADAAAAGVLASMRNSVWGWGRSKTTTDSSASSSSSTSSDAATLVALRHVPAEVWPWDEHPPLSSSAPQRRSRLQRALSWIIGSSSDNDDAASDEENEAALFEASVATAAQNVPPASPAPVAPAHVHGPAVAVAAPVGSGGASPTDVSSLRAHHSHDLDAAGLLVDRGLLANQLAVVLAHEVGHALARHSAEQLSRALPLAFVQLLNNSSPLLAHAFSALYTLPYSRRAEREADRIGLTLMARACFHPGAAHAFWSGFAGTPTHMHYFSTHPADAHRARDAAAWYPKAREEMKRCCRPDSTQRLAAVAAANATPYFFEPATKQSGAA